MRRVSVIFRATGFNALWSRKGAGFTDLSGQKVRPAMVLFVSRKGDNCIVAFITSIVRKGVYAFDIPIPSSRRNGLAVDSVIKLDTLATLQKKIVIGELGTAEPSLMRKIDEKLRVLFQM